VPCLLTLPVSAWCVLVAAIAGLYGCFDTCGPSDSLLNPIAGAEFILGATTFGTLVAGLAVPEWRRSLRRVLWMVCLLAWLGGGLAYYSASRTP
jgi:hypothetical protein